VFDLAYTYQRHKGSDGSNQTGNVDDKYSENRVRAALSLSF
jgi:opacity protein-like surface antigen